MTRKNERMLYAFALLYQAAWSNNKQPFFLLTRSHHLKPDKKSFTIKFTVGEVTKIKDNFH